MRVAQTEAERELIWKARKAAFAAMGRIAPAYYVQDGVIPRTRLSEVLRQIDALAAEYGLQVANVFHAGDGNLHPLVCYDAGREGEAERAEELGGLIIKACVDAGGSITGEHGVGVDKKAYMPSMFSEPDLDAFQRLRCAFDPDGLANPGKVMPTPRLCGEVPGPYREHPLERAGDRRSGSERGRRSSSTSPRSLRGGGRRAGRRRGDGHAVRIVGGGTKLGWGRPTAPADVELRTSGLDRILEHNAGDLTAVLEAGVPLAEAQRDVRRRTGRCWRSTRRSAPATRATIGGIVATGDSGPLRHRYGAPRDLVVGVHGRAQRRDDRPLRGQGDQERRRLRPGQAVRRLVRDARADPAASTSACTRCPPAARPRWAPATTPTCSPPPPRAVRARRSSSRRSTSPGAAGRGGLLARCGGPQAARRARARRAR